MSCSAKCVDKMVFDFPMRGTGTPTAYPCPVCGDPADVIVQRDAEWPEVRSSGLSPNQRALNISPPSDADLDAESARRQRIQSGWRER